MLVKLEGVLVKAHVCVPRSHAHAVWLLPWIEALLSGRSLTELIAAPPWPSPADPLVTRRLLHTLIDLRWAVPIWSRDDVAVAPGLGAAYRAHGRVGLARELFDVTVVRGQWWAEGLSGALLRRQTAAQFDWDHRRRADHELRLTADPQALLDASSPDLGDLLHKLGAVRVLAENPDGVFLGSPLIAGERKSILFAMTGVDVRLLPNELAELEPILVAHAPELFGERTVARSRVVRLLASPVERIAGELERIPVELAATGPRNLLRDRVRRLGELVAGSPGPLAAWLDGGLAARPVLGPTQRHFDAVHEMCVHLDRSRDGVVLLTTAFLHPANAGEPDGLADTLVAAPSTTRFLVLYGHASDDLPDQQGRDIGAWLAALTTRQPTLTGRVVAVATRHRSHEKVVLTSDGDWLVGSWNPGSSRPHATVFEASLAGPSRDLAARLLTKLSTNVEQPEGQRLLAALSTALAFSQSPRTPRGEPAVARLRRAVSLLEQAIPSDDDELSAAWTPCVRAVRAAFQPFLAAVHVEPIDEHQTRDAFVAHVHETRRDILLASDRLADSALDGAVLRDLQGDGRSRRVVRVIWGREWAGRRSTDRLAQDQLQRARRTVRDARERLGPALRTSEVPMENHAKLLVADGLRGIVTSENLLSYGGEKGRRETRELGLMFWSPAIARQLVGRMRLQWPGALDDGGSTTSDGPPLAWIVAGNEGWHGLAAIAPDLDFDWRDAGFIGQVVHDELTRATDDDAPARRRGWDALVARAGRRAFTWVREEGERLGLLAPSATGAWTPYDEVDCADEWLARATTAIAETAPIPAAVDVVTLPPARDPLLARVLSQLVEIPPGKFIMGDDRVPNEGPRHRVTIRRPFLLGRTPVTQGLWEAVMGSLPHLRDVEKHPDYPIIHVSHAEMHEFLTRLNRLPGGGGFTLPTEAQWEYACRAGASTFYCFGDDPGQGDRPGLLERHAWTKRNAGARLKPVGALLPNAFGLHDMHGLVYETMLDGPRTYTRADVTDPVGPRDGARIVARGGFWGRFPVDPRRPAQEHFRCAARQTHESSHRVSLRIARRIQEDA